MPEMSLATKVASSIIHVMNKMMTRKGLVISFVTNGKRGHAELPPLEHYNQYPTGWGPDNIRYAQIEALAAEVTKYNVPGAIAELGVFRGETSKLISSCLPDRHMYLFDTFEGHPDNDVNTQIEKGYCPDDDEMIKDTSVQRVLDIMPNKAMCTVKKGYFPDSLDGLEETFALVSIDCDHYKPTLEGLKYFYPRLSPGGFIIIHDYGNKFGEGIRQALIEFNEVCPISVIPIPDYTGSAIVPKPLSMQVKTQ